MLTRTGSQLLALNGLPAEITSVAQLNQVMALLVSSAPPQMNLSGLEFSASSLMANNLNSTTKSALPVIAKALKSAAAQSAEYSKLRSGLQLVFRYLTSAEYQREFAKSMVDSGVFDDLIARKIEDRMDDISTAGGRVPKERKRRDPVLEEHMHYVVNKMVHRAYNKKGRVVVSELKDWPAPVTGGRVEIEIAPGVREQVWRPVWDDYSSNVEFIDEYLSQVEEEFPDQHGDSELRSALGVFFASIHRGRTDAASGKREEIKLLQNRSSRAQSLLTSMISGFDRSLLNKCRERNLFRHAFNSGGLFISPLAYKDQHGLPGPTSTAPDGGEAGYDGFWLFADLWSGVRTEEGTDIYVVRDVQWWSPLMALGFYVLYEQTKPIPGQRPRTPLFHVPPPYRLEASPDSMPILPPPPGPTDSDTRPAKRSKKSKVANISRGMVNDDILNDERYKVWCLGLVDDPSVDDTASSLPSLVELLADDSNRTLARAARAHLRVPPEMESEVYRSLWRLRAEGSEVEYRQALASDDLAGHMEGLDWSMIGMYE